MADEEKIDFRLNTQADPKGADDMLAKLDELKQRAKDIADAHKKAAEEERKNAEEEKRNATESEIRQRVAADGWAKVSDKIREYGALIKQNASELRGLSAEQQQFIAKTGEAMEVAGSFGTAVATGFSRGGPIGAVVAGAVNAATQIYDSWKEVDTELNKVEQSIRNAAEAQRKLTELKVKLPMAEAAEEAVKKLNTVIELLDKVQQKEAADREANSKIDDIINPATGGEKSLRDNNRAADQINLAANAALEKVKATADVAAAAEANVKAAMDTFGEQSDRYKDAVKERDDAVVLAKKAKEYADKLEEAAPRALAELNAKSTETVQEFKDESLKIATENAKELKTALEQILKSQGGAGSPIFTQVLDTVTRLLENGGVDEGEMKEFQTVVNQFRTTSEAQRNRLSETLIKMMQVNQSIIDGLKERDTEINGLMKSIAEWRQSSAADVAALREQIRTMPR